MNQQIEASFSTLIISLASAATMAMGLTPHEDGSVSKDKHMARLNIDLLLILQNKTKNNLTNEEKQLIDTVLHDLQMKFLNL